MHDQLKITVVATGFDQTKQTLKGYVLPNLRPDEQDITSPNEQKPTVEEPPQKKEDEDVWDIPAFLRQKN